MSHSSRPRERSRYGSCSKIHIIWHWHLGIILRKLHTKHWFDLEYAAPIWYPYNDTQTAKIEMVQRTAARWTCRTVALVIC